MTDLSKVVLKDFETMKEKVKQQQTVADRIICRAEMIESLLCKMKDNSEANNQHKPE